MARFRLACLLAAAGYLFIFPGSQIAMTTACALVLIAAAGRPEVRA